MTPEQRARRLAILSRLWPRQMPVREILVVLDRDGLHWSDETCRRAMKRLGISRPPAPPPAAFGGSRAPTPDDIRAASHAFGSAPLRLPEMRGKPDVPPPRDGSIMTRVRYPQVAQADEQARARRTVP